MYDCIYDDLCFTTFFAIDILNYDYRIVGVLVSILFFFNAFFSFRTIRTDKKYSGTSPMWALVYGGLGVMCLCSSFLPIQYYKFVYLVFPILIYFSTSSRVQSNIGLYPLNLAHTQRRCSSVFYYVLAATMVTELSVINSHLFRGTFMVFVSSVIIWIYFDNIHFGKLKEKKFIYISYTLSNFSLHIFAVVFVTGISRALNQSWDTSLSTLDRFMVCCGLGFTLVSIGLVDRVYDRDDSQLLENPKVLFRYLCGLSLVLLFFGSASLTVREIIYWLLGVSFAQIAFDNFLSPAVSLAEEKSVKDVPITVKSEADVANPRKIRIDNIVQKGTPGNYKRSIYQYLIDGTWNRLIITYITSFVIINLLFAMFYQTQPGSVSGVEEGSFFDAFYFSVQTMSTIGYGQKSPQTPYGDFFVTMEAMVGIMFSAVVTGITFAKFSSVGDSVMFSDKMVITTFEGKKTLMFRLGNARGNDIVDARVEVALLKSQQTDEGHNLRRMVDLKLVRKTSPFSN